MTPDADPTPAALFTATVMRLRLNGLCQYGRYTVGDGASLKLTPCTSPTTPTTSIPGNVGLPRWNCRPSGFWPGQILAAAAADITPTLRALSASSNIRPRSTGTPTVLK